MRQVVTKVGLVFGMMGVLFLGACGAETDPKSADMPHSMEPVEAELHVTEKAEVGATVTLSVSVTQDGAAVDDANEVKFEVWKNGVKEDSEMMPASLDKDGVYTVDTTFEEDGVYTVQVHVTARQMHTMPTTEVTVGEPEMVMEESPDQHAMDTVVSLEPKQATVGEPQPFMVQITANEEMLQHADVQLEIYQEGADKHGWVDLEKTGSGMYKGEYTFERAGTYTVQVHVKNVTDFHEHIMETVEVK